MPDPNRARSIPFLSRLILLLASLLALSAVGPEAGAQNVLDVLRGEGGQAAESSEPEPSLEERTGATGERLAAVEERLATALAGGQTALSKQLERERELLARTKLRQEQSRDAIEDLARLAEEVESLRQEVDSYLASGGEDLGGATFFTLELARDELGAANDRADLIEKQRKAALRQQILAEGAVTTSERGERRAREASLRAKDASAEAKARQVLRESELQAAADSELLNLRRLETELLQARLGQQALAVTRAETKVQRIADVVVFTDEEFAEKNEEIDRWVEDLSARIEVIAGKILQVEGRRDAVSARVGEGDQPTQESEKELQFHRLQLERLRVQQDALQKAKSREGDLREAWLRRKRLSRNEVAAGECATWDADAKFLLDTWEGKQDLWASELGVLRTSLQDAERIRSELPAGAATSLDPTAEIQNAVATIAEAIEEIALDRRVLERLRQDVAAESRSIPWAQRFEGVWSGVIVLWETELLPVGDQSITVRKLVLGLTLFFCGIWAAKRFSRVLGRWLAKRFDVDQGELAVAQTLTFYVLVLLFFLIALRIVNVPLTAFTIFGGAIAIGVGFGSQNLLNNFMSGLILLMEQPIRVGDLIEVGELQGIVERIGARSTVVRTGSNIEIVVPNSTFLEEQVVNLTLSESKLRIHVRVGVAYGSPTREVARLLRRAVEEHGRVLKSPDPIVLFEDFGDDALIFEVHFWIKMRKVMDRRTIESDVRYIIDGVFRDASITIAYPQRDVHLDTTQPLDVRVVSDE